MIPDGADHDAADGMRRTKGHMRRNGQNMMTEHERTERTLQAFEAYDRRFAQAALARPALRPWVEEERKEIIRTVKEVLCFRDDLVPQIRVRSETEVPGRGYTIRDFCYETW